MEQVAPSISEDSNPATTLPVQVTSIMVGGTELPQDIFPQCVWRLYQREETNLFKSSSDYFDAILACQAVRWRALDVTSNAQGHIFSIEKDSYAQPNSPRYNRGRELRSTLSQLIEQLETKRRNLLSSMDSPPLIEAFLDAMEASEEERGLFYCVLAVASGVLRNVDSDVPKFYSHYEDKNGPSIATSSALWKCSDFLSLEKLMNLTSAESKWVKERIYQRCDLPKGRDMCAMEKNTIRCLMGARITASQYHEIESSCLQKVLLANKSFLDSDVAEWLSEEKSQPPPRKKPKKGPHVGSSRGKEEGKPTLVNSLSKHLATSEHSGEGKIFRILGDMHDKNDDNEECGVVVEKIDDEDFYPNLSKKFGPYKSELAYLEEQFQLMDNQVRLQKITSQLETGNLFDSLNEQKYFGVYDLKGPPSKDDIVWKKRREADKLEIKQNKLKDRVASRIRATEAQRNRAPRLEQLSEALHLGSFERFLILELIRSVLDPKAEDGGKGRKVNDYISSFSMSLEGKMNCRKCFYKSAPLVKEGIITISGTDFNSDLNHCSVVLDRRMFDYLVGHDTELSELVEGSHLYTPDVSMDDVILPEGVKELICERALHFEAVKDKYRELEINKKITYGLGQVLLFYGSSGTGKTMMANALAAKLKKKVLLINFPSLGLDSGGVIKLLFREAKIKRAIIFFDECESLFRSRRKGGQSVNTCLTELERFDDMCILATNLACDLDEAMYRRISLAVEFKKPDHILRERIWRTLRPEKLQLEDDVNYKELARKYELSGGFIKNVWLSSVSLMVSRNGAKVSQADLEKAASSQVIGSLANEDLDRQIAPTCGIESIIASDQVAESLKNIVDHRKAQAVLFSQWGFDKLHRSHSGVSALFHGPPGTGKSMAAEAIGFDTGSPLMVVNTAEVVNMYVGETGRNIVTVFREAKQKGAVLVFDEGEALFGTRNNDGSISSTERHDNLNVGLLLQHIENFTGVCIVITNHRDAIDEAFFRRFQFVLKFELPGPRQRAMLWQSIFPKDCPLAADVSLSVLANRYEMCGGDIKSAVLRAASRAALRVKDEERIVTMKDLEESCQEEVSKKSTNDGSKYLYM